MHDSSTFKLQLEGMLRKVQPSYEKRMARIQATLESLKETIENIPDQGPLTVPEAEEALLKQSHVRVPFPEPRPAKDVKYTFSYARPSNINVVGSYARQTAVKIDDQLTIDLAITMPSRLFQENDCLNYRYFYKRAYYLARIAVGLRESKGAQFQVEFSLQNDNHLQPIITVAPNPKDQSCDFAQAKCQIKILLAVDEKLFPVARIAPDRGCLRSSSVSRNVQHNPTPFYNATMRSECCSLRNLDLLQKASCHSDDFKHACVLGSIWLRQRGFGTGLTRGGFGPFEWAYTVALLMQGGGPQQRPILSKRYDSLQIFKATLEYLSARDLVETPICIGRGTSDTYASEMPMLFDGSSGLNVLFKMTPWSYALIRHEATCTLMLLNDPYGNHLEACFITKLDDPIRRFDCLATFNPGQYPTTTTTTTTPTTLLSQVFDAYDSVFQVYFLAHQIIKRAIGDRADLISLQISTPSPWAVTAMPSQSSQSDKLLIGLLLNAQHINRTVDRGPSAGEKELAADFRKFWGEKAELRRFNDGSIQESLIWLNPSNKSILEQILTYALERNLGREPAGTLLMVADTFNHKPFNIPTEVAVSRQPIVAAFELLEKQIRALEDMPLQVRHIYLANAHIRSASPTFTAENSPSLHSVKPANVLLQFEGTSRWPDDLAAIQRTKIALLLKIGELLESAAPSSRVLTRLGLNDSNNILFKDLTNHAFLDITYSSGAFFRLKIYHERELSLLEQALGTSPHGTNREMAASTLSAYKYEFIQSPLHAQAVRTLITRFPVLLQTIYLMKNWCDSQLLSHHLCDEFIELLTIRNFTQPYPWPVPGSAVTGFLRTLAYISNWDWRFDPLIIDFKGEMGDAEYEAITTRFTAWRKIDPAMNRLAIFVASNYDLESVSWTEFGPSKVIAARLTSLAKAASGIMTEQGIGLQASMIFTPSFADYDFVLHLKPEVGFKDSSTRSGSKQKFRNLQIQDQHHQHDLPNIVVHPFLDELRTLYGSNVLFFHDDSGGLLVGGLWNPQTRPRSWKVNVGYSAIAERNHGKDGGQIVLNKTGILHDIADLGGDLVVRIEERH